MARYGVTPNSSTLEAKAGRVLRSSRLQCEILVSKKETVGGESFLEMVYICIVDDPSLVLVLVWATILSLVPIQGFLHPR